MVQAGQPGKTMGLKDTLNPSNTIPPMGKDSIPVPTKPYTLGTPLKLTSSQIGPLKVCTKEFEDETTKTFHFIIN